MRYQLAQPHAAHQGKGEAHAAHDAAAPYVEVLSASAFASSCADPALAAQITEDLSSAQLCKLLPSYDEMQGILVVPDDNDPVHTKRRMAFILDGPCLKLVGDDALARDTLSQITASRLSQIESPFDCLLEVLAHAIADDSDYLRRYEASMEQLEERIIDRPADELNRSLLAVRRELTSLVVYYDNLADMIDEIASSSQATGSHDRHRIKTLARRVDRLFSTAQSLQDFSLTLRQMYQSQIDLRQNKTMRILTVVTMLFLPLTLIAGWFGMNFHNMPAINSDWGYPATIALCVATVVGELIFFVRKGWFK